MIDPRHTRPYRRRLRRPEQIEPVEPDRAAPDVPLCTVCGRPITSGGIAARPGAVLHPGCTSDDPPRA